MRKDVSVCVLKICCPIISLQIIYFCKLRFCSYSFMTTSLTRSFYVVSQILVNILFLHNIKNFLYWPPLPQVHPANQTNTATTVTAIPAPTQTWQLKLSVPPQHLRRSAHLLGWPEKSKGRVLLWPPWHLILQGYVGLLRGRQRVRDVGRRGGVEETEVVEEERNVTGCGGNICQGNKKS